ncbi:MAG: hypothetical protein CL606_02570 [Anaerolineaceae bacterium]|nr:hypothetical protein [Anaerolineaceae bacterium]|tara:strand:+ start:6794 stop:7735 length:942 start_codon:yes stop_codon:yes gene_type:complete
MQYRTLGSTNLSVSVLSIGTVELGMDYGIGSPDNVEHPDEKESIDLLRSAISSGVNLFDTAPSYGDSEIIVGKALGEQGGCYIATKVSGVRSSQSISHQNNYHWDIANSIELSLQNLHREYLDILQIHNADVNDFTNSKLISGLEQAKEQRLINCIGATVYGSDNALAAICSGIVDVIQIPLSVLDQRLVSTVLPEAISANVGVIARSVLLKGALTSKAKYLPYELHPLREAVNHCRSKLGVSWDQLPEYAIRYCLGVVGVHSILVGVRSHDELNYALDAVKLGPLTETDMNLVSDLGLMEENLLNPFYWNIP